MYSDELYREYIIQLYKNPKRYGKITDSNFNSASANPSCGDTIAVYLKINEDGIIENSSFEGKGCVISIASSSLIMDFIVGKNIEEVLKLEQKDVFSFLKIDLSSSPVRTKCAMLPLFVVKEIIDTYKNKKI